MNTIGMAVSKPFNGGRKVDLKGGPEMFTKRFVLPSAFLLLLALLLPRGVSAATETVLGSLHITAGAATATCAAPAPLTDNLFGVVTLANPGLEKTITNHIPPFTHPIFVDVEVEVENEMENSGKRKVRVLERRLDTLVVLTNASATGCLSVKLTVLNAAGTATLNEQTISLNPGETQSVFLANLNLM